jgi:hypothetical protein
MRRLHSQFPKVEDTSRSPLTFGHSQSARCVLEWTIEARTGGRFQVQSTIDDWDLILRSVSVLTLAFGGLSYHRWRCIVVEYALYCVLNPTLSASFKVLNWPFALSAQRFLGRGLGCGSWWALR